MRVPCKFCGGKGRIRIRIVPSVLPTVGKHAKARESIQPCSGCAGTGWQLRPNIEEKT